MGLDLRLLVVDGPSVPYSHTVISLDRENYELWDRLKALHPQKRPEIELRTFAGQRIEDGPHEDEKTYGVVRETPYGEPLTYLYATDFVQAWSGFDFSSDINRAALAFIRELKPTTLIALYWH